MYWELSDGQHQLLLPEEVPGGETESGRTVGPISLTYGNQSDVRHKLEIVSPWIGQRTWEFVLRGQERGRMSSSTGGLNLENSR
jgi:hypothetical protein